MENLSDATKAACAVEDTGSEAMLEVSWAKMLIEAGREVGVMVQESGVKNRKDKLVITQYPVRMTELKVDPSLRFNFRGLLVKVTVYYKGDELDIPGCTNYLELTEFRKVLTLPEHVMTNSVAVENLLQLAELIHMKGMHELTQEERFTYLSICSSFYEYDIIPRDDKNGWLLVYNTCCSTCRQTANDGETYLKCGGCEMIFYCSINCQRKDWKKHRDVCKKYPLNMTQL